MTAATVDDLAGIPLFDTLEPSARAEIAPWFELQEVGPGVRLTGEGAFGYSFFVLCDGSATVSIAGNDVRTLGAGDFFGELALLGDGHRTATVTTDSPSQVLVLFGAEFGLLREEYPQLGARIESGLREIAQAA